MITRRSFLARNYKLAISLPLLGVFEKIALCQDQAGDIRRFVTYSFPNGCAADLWKFDQCLSPLSDIRDRLLVFENTRNMVTETFGGDGHQQGAASMFVGAPMKNDIQAGGASLDQVVSAGFDRDTVLRQPIVAGVYRGLAGGAFRPITWKRRSWDVNGQPVPMIVNPLEGFYQIFGISKDQSPQYQANRKSILDAVLDQYKGLLSDRSPLGRRGKEQMTYVAARIREIETNFQRVQSQSVAQCRSDKKLPPEYSDVRDLVPYELFDEIFDHHMDLVVTAFQCDMTRTASLMFGSAGEEYERSDLKLSCHKSSHYDTEEGKQTFIEYRRHHMRTFKSFVEKLSKVTDSSGASLFDQTVVLASTEIGESRTHDASPQPHLIGTGLKSFNVGQVLDLQGRSTNDLYRAVLSGIGVEVESVGHPTLNSGVLSGVVK